VADSVLAAVGVDAEKVFVDERLGQVDRHIGSTDKLKRLTGWRARTSFERGLEQTVAWYRENEGWWKALRTRDSVSSS
jgi:dTDP-glucose 4,6-dehydratase